MVLTPYTYLDCILMYSKCISRSRKYTQDTTVACLPTRYKNEIHLEYMQDSVIRYMCLQSPLRVRSYGGRVSSCRALHVHCSSTQPRRLKPVGSRDGRRVLVDLATREQHADSPRCHEPFLSQTQATACLRLAEEGCIFVRESNLELPGWISSLCVPDT